MTDKTQEQLEIVRNQAKELNVPFHHRANINTIQAAIDAHLAAQNTMEDDLPEPLGETPLKRNEVKPLPVETEKIVPMSEADFKAEQQIENKKRVRELVRVRIQCMNPSKKDWPGEIVSVGSAKLGTFKKYIPFNTEPYHIPRIIFDMLSEKQCSVFYNTTDERGHKTRKARQIKEYAIEVLEPLSPQEIEDLRVQQTMAKGKVA